MWCASCRLQHLTNTQQVLTYKCSVMRSFVVYLWCACGAAYVPTSELLIKNRYSYE